ncbi:MAG: hypothetical protein HQK78_05280 [Desulfobacterales bacterium]|nr:hypothetical protein [Desulfobacterales bacterium]
MSIRISLLLPSRGRASQLKNFLDSVVSTSLDLESIEVILYLDEDDIESHSIFSDKRLKIIKIIGNQRLSMGGYNTACMERASGEILILMNDDIIIRTPNWDRIIWETHLRIKDGFYLAYANDLYMKRRICTFPILSKKVCDLIKFPFPKEYQGALIDYHLFDVFKRLEKKGHNRIIYFPNIIFEHLHFRAKKSSADETYLCRNRFGDDVNFFKLNNLRSIQANLLYDAILNKKTDIFSYTYSTFKLDNVIFALRSFMNLFLFNKDLPSSWGSYLFSWYSARYLASHGYLRYFGVDDK